ncbi:cytochrome ubiquinol oxidase subunit I [Piscinibacter defluvii]|jgi:cytochrome d ubiquinol oxidase subunit I|uniref:cytochrome ubiquinol oxidase subunit I n=1 Tax=Piscinibacter defluvii TaxID=1796922 RepID=UPI000FDF25AF|nr:cytochrome ubiquinol oxidase subunit I [Piscinibacter defluvii]
MLLDPLILSRIQFAFVVAFHIVFPAFTVGLASYIALLEGLYLARRDERYLRASKFWLRIFAVSFGMGVVSGIVMPFQFGTNWAAFSDKVANVVGPLLAYEGLTAFFLEAGFLGVLLFGRERVPPWAHFGAAVLVAAGTLFSSFWILAFNSWMQTPAGYVVEAGRFVPADFSAVIFNPSFPYRLTHTVSAFYVTTGFVVLGVAAHHLARGRHRDTALLMARMAVFFLAVMTPLQIALGDAHGLNTLAHQPAKVAAMEGLWETSAPAPSVLFAIPDQAEQTNRLKVSIPRLASLYLTHTWSGEVRGLKSFPREDQPPVAPVFFAFRIMVGIGTTMLAVAWWGAYLAWRGRLETSPVFLRVAQWMLPSGFIAVLAGWTVTEVGRQPWTVYGLLRTADSVSPSLSTADVGLSLAAYLLVYAVVYAAAGYYLVKLVRHGPADAPPAGASARPARPLSAAVLPVDAEASRGD